MSDVKKLVSLVDRTDFDEYVYPKDGTSTKFQPNQPGYHNYTQETAIWPFAGSPNWGQRITFTVPWPWQGDFLNWIVLRLKPMSWLPKEAQERLPHDWVPVDPDNFWVWANNLGTVAIARAEMEVGGVIVEQFSGDWADVYSKTAYDVNAAASVDDLTGSYKDLSVRNFRPSEDGFIYCELPFWFTKHANTAFPLLSCAGPVRFHITLRPFSEVVRKLHAPFACKETPCGSDLVVRDYSFPFRKLHTMHISAAIPAFETADILCGISHIDGALRDAYEQPHEILMAPVVETVFHEPLKYTLNTPAEGQVRIGLPLTEANGPIRQIFFFLRRKTVFNDWTNYSATDSLPLLVRAQLMAGTAVWADEDERWWRANNVTLPGGIRAYERFIYVYNFADRPAEFSPSGSLNTSRVDLRLNLTVRGGEEWTVSVFFVGTNWMRFQNGLANQLFMD